VQDFGGRTVRFCHDGAASSQASATIVTQSRDHGATMMDTCSFAEIEQSFNHTISCVADAQGIDPICSTSPWIVSVSDAFNSDAQRIVRASRNGYMALLLHDTPHGGILSSFDAVWGFATPFIGADPAALIGDVAAELRTLDYATLVVSGLDPASALFEQVQRLGPSGYTDTADRCVVDLSDGFDRWLGRRSSRFRRSLRAAAHRGETAGIEIVHLSPAPAEVDEVFDRLLAIEARSWKTDVHSGLVDTQLGRFTLAMAHRFAATGSLRVQFARLDGIDIGYVIGARHGDRYRGFQHSFDQSYPSLSIGKLLQFHAISAMADDGAIAYDMGMHMGYKESYADRIESTVTAIIPADR
jgi:hypothetical protein